MSAVHTEYTPQPDHISPPNSITPTRHGQSHSIQSQTQSTQSQSQSQSSQSSQSQLPSMSDFTSPSAYINHDAYTLTDTNYDHSASSSISIPHSASMSDYDFSYADFGDYVPMDELDPDHSQHSNDTNGGVSHPDDDRTPIVTDNQARIPPRSFPAPQLRRDDRLQLSPNDGNRKPLMSPFRQYAGIPGAEPNDIPMTFTPGSNQQQQQQQHQQPAHFVEASGQLFYAPPGSQIPPGSFLYEQSPDGVFAPIPPSYNNIPSHIGGHMYQQPGGYYAHPPHPHNMVPGQSYDFGQPRSINGSPTSTISSAVSLTRSASTSSDLRHVRPKVKLTWEDKRNIVELHRANCSLRQEDIARQYG